MGTQSPKVVVSILAMDTGERRSLCLGQLPHLMLSNGSDCNQVSPKDAVDTTTKSVRVRSPRQGCSNHLDTALLGSNVQTIGERIHARGLI